MAKAPKAKNAVAEAKTTALADAALFDDMPTGMEQVSADDLLIPRMTILQALSPQLKRTDPNYIEGANQGDFCDTGTNELFGEELHLLPVYYARIYLEWAPLGSGDGLIANHGTDASVLDRCTRDENNRNVTPEGNYIAETATYFCLNLSAGGRPCFVPMSSTQLKNARRWMTLIQNQRIKREDGSEFMPPIYYRSWKAKSVPESNNKGEWFGWRFEADQNVLELDPTKSLLQQAKDFCEQAASGLVQGDVAGMDESQPAATGDNAAM